MAPANLGSPAQSLTAGRDHKKRVGKWPFRHDYLNMFRVLWITMQNHSIFISNLCLLLHYRCSENLAYIIMCISTWHDFLAVSCSSTHFSPSLPEILNFRLFTAGKIEKLKYFWTFLKMLIVLCFPTPGVLRNLASYWTFTFHYTPWC